MEIRDWPLAVTIVDLCWGAVLGGLVSWASAVLGRALLEL